MRRGSRGVSYALGLLFGVIVLVILLLIFYPTIFRPIVRGLTSINDCDGECLELSRCPDSHWQDDSGTPWCNEKQSGVCCIPKEGYEGVIVRPGDLEIYFQGSRDPLDNGETVTLDLRKDVTGEFTVNFGRRLEQYECYGQIAKNNGERKNVRLTELFKGNYDSYEDIPEMRIVESCRDVKETVKFTLNQYWQNFGSDYTHSIVIVDRDTCEDSQGNADLDFCERPYTHSIRIRLPVRRPAISLTVDGQQASKTGINVLEDGPRNLELQFTEPLAQCGSTAQLVLNTVEGEEKSSEWSFLDSLRLAEFDCFDTRSKRISFTISPDIARGIPFDMTVATYIKNGNEIESTVEETYRFQIAPHKEFKAFGPATHLAREKTIDIRCDSITCEKKDLSFYAIADPLACKPGLVDGLIPLEESQLAPYAGEGSNRYRLTLKSQMQDGKYICAKFTGTPEYYALGLWRDVPTPLAIDNESPIVTAKYDFGLKQVLTFECTDKEGKYPENPADYVSGCKERPFSYAYVNNPLIFASHVTKLRDLFQLDDKFLGCPELDDESKWIQFNGLDNTMEYISGDVRVICLRATDNAGNHNVTTKLLYSTEQAIAAVMQLAGNKVS